MKEGKSTVKTSAGKENEPITESTSKKKTKEEKPSTKVVVRRLPHSMTEEQFKMQVAPMPDHDYFYFVPADMSLMPNAFSRAYINFIDQNDLFIFTEKFDGYVFVDSKGGEFPAIVEFAPFQRIPKNRPTRKKDSKVGTIEADPVYIAFKERLEADNLENKTATNVSKQHFFETSSQDKKEEVNNTPLLDFIRNKRAERQRLRDEKREEKRKKDLERRKAKEEQRKVKKEDETVVKNPKPLPPTNLNPKTKEALIDKGSNLSSIKSEKSVSSNQSDKLSKSNNEEKVSKKVSDVIGFFHDMINEGVVNKCRSNEAVNSALPAFKKHEDLEKAILKSGEWEVTSKVVMPPTSSVKFHKMMNPNFEESVSGPGSPLPIFGPRGRLQMCVPRNERKIMFSRSHSDIIMRPIRLNSRDVKEGQPDIQSFVKECEIVRPVRPIRFNIPVIPNQRSCDAYNQVPPFDKRMQVRINVPLGQNIRYEINDSGPFSSKAKNCHDIKESNGKNNKFDSLKDTGIKCSSKSSETKKGEDKAETLKKNLQKVVADVLGNTQVSSPKENFINKPKTFVRRYSGVGDECRGKGYNTPNFYLPPRAFGFGMVDSKQSTFDTRNRTNAPRSFSSSIGRVQFSKKSLPPFSKNPVSLSKSDGDIEKPETVIKAGGSEENVVSPPPKTFIAKRPFGAPVVSKV